MPLRKICYRDHEAWSVVDFCVLLIPFFRPASVAQYVVCPLRDREVPGSIPGRDIPKMLTMVLVAPRLALGFSG